MFTDPKFAKKLHLNDITILSFEVMFKLITYVFAIPLFSLAEHLTMKLTGYQYLSAENLGTFFSHPLFILCILLFILSLSLYCLFEISAVIYNMHKALYNEKTDVFHTALYGCRQIQSVLFSRGNRKLLPVILLMIPFLCFGLFPAFASNLLVKELILSKLRKKPYLLPGLCIVIGTLLVFFLQLMFTCQIMMLEKVPAREACRRSLKLGKTHRRKDFSAFLKTQIVCYIAYALLLGIAILLAVLLDKILMPMRLVNSISTAVMLTISNVSFCLFASWTMPVCCICIGALYYQHKEDNGEELPDSRVVDCVTFSPFLHRFSKVKSHFSKGLFVICILICSLYVYMTYKGRLNPSIEYVHQTEITAHRGASRYFPENTMAAIKGAMEQGADWIELDIHQSSDGVLFVMHDDNLYRTCRVKGLCWNYTWEELSRMDAGNAFSNSFKGEPIPRLSDVIDYAIKNGLRLNIELKPSSFETGMEKRLVDLLEEKAFINDCVVTSQKYLSISKIKEYNPDITTVYVMGYAYGNVDRLKAADHFSINMSSVSRPLVSRIHNAGKQVFVWTVNSRTYIEDMMEKNVDNIITNDVLLAKKIVGEMHTSSAFYEYIKLLHRLFSFG